MRQPGKFIYIFFLMVIVVVVALGANIFMETLKPPGTGIRKAVKKFPFLSGNSLDEWQEKVLSRGRTDYSVMKYDGKSCVKAISSDSASALYYKQRLSYKDQPFLSWDWKVEKFPSWRREEALDKKSEFDFGAQVYVIFYSKFFLNAKAIQYVWTENIPVGTVTESPYTNKVKVVVLRSGISNEWKHEERDIREDFKRYFGEESEKDVAAVSFMTDSDSTDSSALAYYGNITLGYLEKKGQPGSDEEAKKVKIPGEVEVKKRHLSENQERGNT